MHAADYKILDLPEGRTICYVCGRKGVWYVEKRSPDREKRKREPGLMHLPEVLICRRTERPAFSPSPPGYAQPHEDGTLLSLCLAAFGPAPEQAIYHYREEV